MSKLIIRNCNRAVSVQVLEEMALCLTLEEYYEQGEVPLKGLPYERYCLEAEQGSFVSRNSSARLHLEDKFG